MSRQCLCIFVVAFLCAPAALWAQSAGGKGQPPPNRPVSISGSVRDRAGNASLANVRVLLESVHFGTSAETSTDSNGRFTFNGIGHGIYFVTVKASGYRGASDVTRTCDPASCRRVDLTVGTSEFVSFMVDRIPNEVPNISPAGPSGTLNAQDAAVPERAQREYEAGVKALDSGQVESAVSHLEKAITAYPQYASAYFRLGTTYADQRKWGEAVQALRRATSLNPKLSAAQLALGSVYLEQGDFVSAELPLKSCLAVDPQNPFAHFGLARSELARNALTDAEAEARKTLEAKPDFAAAYVLLGNVYLRRRDAESALKAYQQYLHLEPQGPMAADTRNVLQQLNRVVHQSN